MILDVEATYAVRQAEVESTKVMIDRVEARFGLTSARLIGDTEKLSKADNAERSVWAGVTV